MVKPTLADVTGVRCDEIVCDRVPVRAEVARFRGRDGVEEAYVAARPTAYGGFAEQLAWLERGDAEVRAGLGLGSGTAVVRRLFCSDIANQTAILAESPFASGAADGDACAVAWVGQPPLGAAKVALWAYHISDEGGAPDKRRDGASVVVRRGALAHHWTCGLHDVTSDRPDAQTAALFQAYEAHLGAHGMTLADHVVRTWILVRDIDRDYEAMAAARRRLFAERSLTADTHYIASTGIEGVGPAAAARVVMDGYAIEGLEPAQVRFLRVPAQLSATDAYGVTFERGTAIAYRDRRHLWISGTASIDDAGRTRHVGNVARQLERTLANIDALLATGGAGTGAVCQLIAYVRDMSDGVLVRDAIRARFGPVPLVVVRGAVCRPAWLVEVEAGAIVGASEAQLPPF